MSSLDDQISAKKAKDKKKKSRKKKHHNHGDDDESHTSSKKTASGDMADIVAERKKDRRMHDLASSGLPKQPPELEYNLDPLPPRKEKKKKKKHHVGELKSPPEELLKQPTVPGAVAASNSDLSAAERTKFGQSNLPKIPEAASIPSVASAPGVKHERAEDLSQAERLKYGYAKKSSSDAGSDSNVASMPGARQTSTEDMSQAERLKHGYRKSSGAGSKAASMPGARQENAHDMSQAERLKHGYQKSASTDSNVASVPGARQGNMEDVSEAERLKYGHKSTLSTSSYDESMSGAKQRATPGVKQERSQDISQAERLKYGEGNTSRHKQIGAVAATDSDIDAAARLKFSDDNRNEQKPALNIGAVQGDSANTSEAERIKFGLVQEMAKNVNRSDDESRGSADGDESYHDEVVSLENVNNECGEQNNHNDIEANNTNSADTRRRHRPRGIRSRISFTGSFRSSEEEENRGARQYLRSFRESFMSMYSDDELGDGDNPDSFAKREVEIWKPLCQLCTCISLIIVIALSASLAASNKRSSTYDPSVAIDSSAEITIVATVAPTGSPSLSPTTAPEDYSFCYQGNEKDMLEDGRYSSIRSELVSSGISAASEFSDKSSYQRKALCWLTYGDRLEINVTDPFLEQRYALATIYFGLNQSQSLLDKGWLSGASECQWKPMVECDSRTDSTVTKLALSGNELIGALPKELSYLRDVGYLDLGENLLEGDVVDVIGSLSDLSSLRLASNGMTSFPDLSVFSSLKHFDISHNMLTGTIPETLSALKNLVYLDLSTNSFGETIPSVLGELKSLDALYLHNNDLTGSVPEEVCVLATGNLDHLTVDCFPPSEVLPNKQCITECGYYDQKRANFPP